MQNHGNKKYLQILLDPARAALLGELAEEKGLKPTAMVRELVYQGLARSMPSTLYNEAAAMDEATWRKSVRSRVEGRQASRLSQQAKSNLSHETPVTQPETPKVETPEISKSEETQSESNETKPRLLSLASLSLQTSQPES